EDSRVTGRNEIACAVGVAGAIDGDIGTAMMVAVGSVVRSPAIAGSLAGIAVSWSGPAGATKGARTGAHGARGPETWWGKAGRRRRAGRAREMAARGSAESCMGSRRGVTRETGVACAC